MRINRWDALRSAGLVLLAAAAMTACGNPPDQTAGGPSPSAGATAGVTTGGAGPSTSAAPGVAGNDLPTPCQWISESEVAGIIGTTARKTTDEATVEGRSCSFGYPAEAPTATVTVTLWQGRQHYTPDTGAAGFTAVPGIGDAAHAGPYFILRRGDTVIRVAIGADDASRPDNEKRIAQLIATRLP